MARTAVSLGEGDDCFFGLVPGKLGIAFHRDNEQSLLVIRRRPDLYFFSTGLHEAIETKQVPVTLGIISRFLQVVSAKANDPRLRSRPLIYYTDFNAGNQKNAVLLLGAYMMLEQKFTATKVIQAFEAIAAFSRWNTASASMVNECFFTLEKALDVGLFSPVYFDLALHEELADLPGGWAIVADKFLVLPARKEKPLKNKAHATSVHGAVLKHFGVKTVIRLNGAGSADKAETKQRGVKVVELLVEVGESRYPPPAVTKQFLDLVDNCMGKVAVESEAGEAKAASMMALWTMRRFGLSVHEATTWVGLCGGGWLSQTGPEQQWLAVCDQAQWDDNNFVLLAPLTSASAASGASTPLATLPVKHHVEAPEAPFKAVRFADDVDDGTAPRPSVKASVRGT